MKRGVMILIAATLVAAQAAAITGKEVAQHVYNRDNGNSVHALVEMVLTDKNGDTNNRIVEGWGMDNDQDLQRAVIVFHRPASVQGTRFLLVENQNRDDDQWIYLPALQRVRRIAASEGGQSFMGTDYTYDDLKTRQVDDDTHSLLREETLDGFDCYVVQSVPKDLGNAQYSKRIQWVDRQSWVPVKMELYDKDGTLEKVNRVEELKKVQDYWTPMKSIMENVQSGHATTITIQKILYNENLPQGMFSTRFLETGRVQ